MTIVTDKEMEDDIHPVMSVDPRIESLRQYKHKRRDINKPYQRAMLYNWAPNLQKS
jgi:hypothetical protein